MSAVESPPVVTPEAIFDIASGFMAAKHLFVANEVGLFEQLASGPATLDDLAQRAGIATERVRILADAMCALGLVQRDGDRYRNGPVAAAFLTGAGPVDLRPFLRFWDHLSYPMWTKLEDAVRTGQGQGTMELSGELQRIFSEGVEAIQAVPSRALPAAYDFGPHRRVLDLGGGTGSWLLALLERYPSLEGTLFDLPNAAAIARQRLAAAAPGQRAQVVAGDFFTDPIPDGHDVVLIANVIHLLSPERNRELLRSTRAHVAGGARLLLADFWTDPTHTEPRFAALMAGEFLVITGEGDVYSEQEVRGWLGETGWELLERRPLAGPVSLIVAEAVR
ncbi:MAG: acetylserotonin O-methyltransferase [Chloroflexota bacterium]|nr:acetylserotonin O-methyltransferase [Chloroflexota bacterium]